MKKSNKISLALLVLLLVVAVVVMVAKVAGDKNISNSGEWTIYTSEGTTEAANSLQKSIKSTGVINAKVVTNAPESWNGRLILVGETEEAASKEAVLTLKEDEFFVKFGKDFIVITGGSDEATTEAINYVNETYTSYLEENCDYPFGAEYDYISLSKSATGKTKQLLFNGVSYDKFQIVAEKGAKNEAAVLLQTAIKNMTGTELEVVEEQAEESYGIVIESGKNGAAKELKDQQFRIYQDETKLYLCAANPEQEMLVVKMLLTKYMSYEHMSDSSTQGMVNVEVKEFKFTCNWDEFTAPKAVQSKILHIEAKEGYSVLQGGCTDGKYAYYILQNADFSPRLDRIYKVDLASMEIVAESETLELQHANSLLYNSKLNTLININYDPDGQVLTYVDPATLKVTGTKKVDFHALSMSYSEERDQYVAGTLGTFDFFTLDNNFKVKDYHESIQTTSVKQEVEIFKDRLFFSMSGESVIFVYNWDGDYLYTIDMELPIEIENVVFYEDVAYTGYYSSGGLIYETIFYQEIQ